MKKCYLFFFFLLLTKPLFAQFVVSDPASISQRIALFMEELGEKLIDRNELVAQTFNTTEMLKQAQ